MSSSNFGIFSGAMPSFDSTIPSRRLVSVSLRHRGSIVKRNTWMVGGVWTYSLWSSNRA
jgi:hypothetical protein